MYIVFCNAISSMGKKFEDHADGIKEMGEYIVDCLTKYPEAKITIDRFQQEVPKWHKPLVIKANTILVGRLNEYQKDILNLLPIQKIMFDELQPKEQNDVQSHYYDIYKKNSFKEVKKRNEFYKRKRK